MDDAFFLSKFFAFPDAVYERKALTERVYTQLKQHARSLGLQLHTVDMYAGLSDIHDDRELPYKMEDEGVFDLCLKEIELCHGISAGPSFIVSGDGCDWTMQKAVALRFWN